MIGALPLALIAKADAGPPTAALADCGGALSRIAVASRINHVDRGFNHERARPPDRAPPAER
jgi:hypothetical protein